MHHCQCLIGNSSAGIRESCYLGTPVVNIGSRQNLRERGKNVLNTGYNRGEIFNAIKKQITHGRYAKQMVYGKGDAGEKIIKILSSIRNIKIQKTLIY